MTVLDIILGIGVLTIIWFFIVLYKVSKKASVKFQQKKQKLNDLFKKKR